MQWIRRLLAEQIWRTVHGELRTLSTTSVEMKPGMRRGRAARNEADHLRKCSGALSLEQGRILWRDRDLRIKPLVWWLCLNFAGPFSTGIHSPPRNGSCLREYRRFRGA